MNQSVGPQGYMPAATPAPSSTVARRSRASTTIATAVVALGLMLAAMFAIPVRGAWAGSDIGSVTQSLKAAETQADTAGQVGTLATGVVLIESTLDNGTAMGTGMVLTATGQVLTNYHVVADSTKVQVTIASSGATYTATVVGHDESRDIALLQLSGASGLKTVTLDDDGDDAAGSTVTAVGNASGQGFLSAASGTLTRTGATITVSDESNPSVQRTMTGLIETSAQAVPGDSGGPLYDAEGEVIGVTSAGTQAQSQGAGRPGQTVTTESYAISIQTALSVVDQVRDGVDTATVSIGRGAFLGVNLSSDGSIAEVVAGGPAAKAGLVAGDVITQIGSTRIASVSDISEAIGALDAGEKATVTWTSASGSSHSAQVTFGESPRN